MLRITGDELAPVLTLQKQEAQSKKVSADSPVEQQPEQGRSPTQTGAPPKVPVAPVSNGHGAESAVAVKAAPADAEPGERSFEVDVKITPQLKLRVRFHEATRRFIYQSVDQATGKVVRQHPPEEALEMIERLRDVAGLTVDTKL